MTEKEYRDHPAISQSDIKNLLVSYPEFLYAIKNNEETPAKILGTAFHCAIMEPEKFVSDYVVFEGEKRTNAAKDKYKELIDSGKIVLTVNDYDMLLGMTNSFQKSEYASLLKDSIIEEPIFFKHQGIECKSRPDLIKGKIIVDFKSIDDSSKKSCLNSVLNRKYYLQDNFYNTAFFEKYGDFAEKFYYIFVQKSKYYPIRVIELDSTWNDLARKDIQTAFKTLKEANESNVSFETLDVPIWLR